MFLFDFLSLATLTEDLLWVSIKLRFSNDLITLHIEPSSNKKDPIESKALVDLVQNYQVTFTTLTWSPAGKKKSTDSFQTPKILHIVIHGVCKDVNDTSDFLEDSELFLQLFAVETCG